MNFRKISLLKFAACILLAGLLFLAPFLFGAGHPYLPVQSLPDLPFIDMHCHTAGLGAGNSGCFVSDRMRHSYKLSFYLKSFGVTEAEVLREGDAIILQRIPERLAGSQHVPTAV